MTILLRLLVNCFDVADTIDNLATFITKMSELCEAHINLVPELGTHFVINKLCNILSSDNIELRTLSVKCLTVMLTFDNAAITNFALEAGILHHLTSILDSASTQMIANILFSLSNITAGT